MAPKAAPKLTKKQLQNSKNNSNVNDKQKKNNAKKRRRPGRDKKKGKIVFRDKKRQNKKELESFSKKKIIDTPCQQELKMKTMQWIKLPKKGNGMN